MRSACVLRQLGRCAESPQLLPTSWGYNAVAHSCYSGLVLRQRKLLRGRARTGGGAHDTHAHARPFTTSSPTLQAPPGSKASPPPLSPSVHAHTHTHASTALGNALTPVPRPEQFRAVMRLLPTSVVVCTSTCATSSSSSSSSWSSAPAPAPAPSPSPSQAYGMTMSSFTSLSLQPPTPLITLNMATPSRTLDAVAQSRAFNIHVLSGDAEGARVADWFRRGNAAALGVFDEHRLWEGCGCRVVVRGEEGRRGGKGGAADAPLLRGKGVLYGLRCELLDDEPNRGLVRVRDHVLVLAEVVDIVGGRGEQDGEEVFGLAYADRRYRQLGATIDS